MTTSEAVDTLLYGRYDRVNIEEAISSNIAPHILRAAEISRPVYVVGNGGDFREVAVPIAKSLGRSLAGVACLWTHEMTYSRPDGRPAFSIPYECVEPTNAVDQTILFCQSIISTAEEMIAIISRALNTRPAEAILVSSILMHTAAKEELRSYYGDEIDIEFYGIEIDTSLLNQQHAVFHALDDRPIKIAPLMSRWLAHRIFGPKPILEKTYTYGDT